MDNLCNDERFRIIESGSIVEDWKFGFKFSKLKFRDRYAGVKIVLHCTIDIYAIFHIRGCFTPDIEVYHSIQRVNYHAYCVHNCIFFFFVAWRNLNSERESVYLNRCNFSRKENEIILKWKKVEFWRNVRKNWPRAWIPRLNARNWTTCFNEP